MTKRRSPGQGTIKKIRLRSGRPAYRGWITVGYKVNAEGEKVAIKRSCQAATKAQVEAGLERLRARYRVGVDFDADRMRLRELFDKWLAYLEAVEKPPARTLHSYRWGATRCCTALGDPLVVRVAPYQLQALIIGLQAELGRSSLNTLVVVLKRTFAQAVIWRIVPESPAAGLKVPRGGQAEKPQAGRALTPDQVARFRAALSGERLELAAVIVLAYGLRRGEAAAIRADQFDMERGTLTIDAQHQYNRTTRQVDRCPTKGGDVRVFPVPEWLRPLVARQIERTATERRAMGAQWTAPDEGLLFVRETDGGRLDGQQIYKLVQRAAERAGLGKLATHDLRRTLQSLLGREGVDRNVRAAIAGHADADTTDRHYRLVYEGEAGEALAKMAQLLGLDQTATPEGDDAI